MKLQEQINLEIKKAMISKESDKLTALRSVKSAFLSELTKDGSSIISDEVAIKIIKKIVKQRKESAHIYSQKGRQDLANQELVELNYLQKYLPDEMSKIQIREIVLETIRQMDSTNIGIIIGGVMKKVSGKADGKIVSEIVKEELNK